MVTLNQAIAATDAVTAAHLTLQPEWCSCVRNREANCCACMDACPHEAILAGENELLVNPDACTGCGACANACPTQAVTTTQPTRTQTMQQAASIAHSSKRLAYCCAQAGVSSADDARFIDVTCLAQLDEAELAQAAINGATAIALVSGDCETCPNAKVESCINQNINEFCKLMEFWGITSRISRTTATQQTYSADPAHRREALQEILGDARNAAAQTAINALAKESSEPSTLADSLTTEVGNLKKRVPPRATSLLNSLFELPQQPEDAWSTRLFGQVGIDETLCQHCGKCSFFCPTGALEMVGEPPRPAVMGVAPAPAQEAHHTFRACDCVHCNLCADVCPNGALCIGDVDAKSLFELEPQRLP